MRIQSISIVPENVGCNAKCKYCISAMTTTPRSGTYFGRNVPTFPYHKLENALLYAKAGGCQTAILTSKGETLLSNWAHLGYILQDCKRAGQIGQKDLHTNGVLILDNKEKFIQFLVEKGLTNITLTVASLDKYVNKELMGIDLNYKNLFKFLKNSGIHIRLSCVLNKKGVMNKETLDEYILSAIDLGIDAIVFRELWVPQETKKTNIVKWSKENFVPIETIRETLLVMKVFKDARPIVKLPWGEIVYEVYGRIQVSTATCTINNYLDGFKSIIFLPDGHLYTGWDSLASKIF